MMLVFLLIIGFVVFFAGIFLLVMFIIKKVSGGTQDWEILSKYFTLPYIPDNISTNICSVRIGRLIYRNSCRIGFDGNGIYLSAMKPFFRLNDLFIPYDKLDSKGKTTLFWEKSLLLQVKIPEGVRIALMRKQVNKLFTFTDKFRVR